MKLIRGIHSLLHNHLLHNITLVAILFLAYVTSVYVQAPGYNEQPYGWVIHLLFILGFATLFFALLDLLIISILYRISSRDALELGKFARDNPIEPFLADQKENDQMGEGPKIKELGGGLIFDALQATARSGNPDGNLFLSNLSRSLDRCLPGFTFLGLSIRGGPIVGLLGTVLGLKLTFEAHAPNLDQSQNGIMSILPYLGAALVTTMMGLLISLFGLALRDWLIKLVRKECEFTLYPAAHRIATHLEQVRERFETEPQPPGRTWRSNDFLTGKSVATTLLLFLTIWLIVLCSPRNGILDKMLMINGPQNEQTTTESKTTPAPTLADIQKLLEKSKRGSQQKKIETSLENLLDHYQQAFAEKDPEEIIHAYHLFSDPIEEGVHNQGVLQQAATLSGRDTIPISGVLDMVEPPENRHLLDEVYPRIVARFDIKPDPMGGKPSGIITYLMTGEPEPIIKTVGSRQFIRALERKGYDFFKGILLDRRQLPYVLPETSKRKLEEKADIQKYPIRRWMAFEHPDKLKRSFDQRIFKGHEGDYVVFHWNVRDDNGSISVESGKVDSKTAKEVFQYLNMDNKRLYASRGEQ